MFWHILGGADLCPSSTHYLLPTQAPVIYYPLPQLLFQSSVASSFQNQHFVTFFSGDCFPIICSKIRILCYMEYGPTQFLSASSVLNFLLYPN